MRNIPDDVAAPKSTGDCAGKYEYMPDGSWKGSGTCTYAIKGEDKGDLGGGLAPEARRHWWRRHVQARGTQPSAIRWKQGWQLGDVARYASSLIKGQRLGDLSIALIGGAVDIGEALTVRVNNLEAAV